MMTERDIEVRICEIENEIAKEKRSESPSDTKINQLMITLDVLNWVLIK
jgi:hypothetical protein